MAYVDISGREQAAKQEGIQRGLAQLFKGAETMREDDVRAAATKRQAAQDVRTAAKDKADFVSKRVEQGQTIEDAEKDYGKYFGTSASSGAIIPTTEAPAQQALIEEPTFLDTAVSGVSSLFGGKTQDELNAEKIPTPELPKQDTNRFLADKTFGAVSDQVPTQVASIAPSGASRLFAEPAKTTAEGIAPKYGEAGFKSKTMLARELQDLNLSRAQFEAGERKKPIEETRAMALARARALTTTEAARPEKIQKEAKELSREIVKSNIPSAVSSMKNLDTVLPGGLYGTGEIPGFSEGLSGLSDSVVAGLEKTGLAPEGSSKSRQAVASVFNVVLKDRSGAAVTTPEMDRLKSEFGRGFFRTSDQLRSAMQKYNAELISLAQTIEGGVSDEALGQYRSKKGTISSGSFPQQKSKSKNASPGSIINSGGKRYQVGSDGETITEI